MHVDYPKTTHIESCKIKELDYPLLVSFGNCYYYHYICEFLNF